MRIKCDKCGSVDIRWDAVVEWSELNQDFAIVDILDNCWCEPCSSEFDETGDPQWIDE